ncbi:BamA/TamA family outer membrane protein [Hymenobacter sp. CRA2]|uniref:translocation and assembly module lipoprotein TamL n=1 Tax=Hymenobacter sp. CRA2 TaxID=1955620 RepID=UPI00098F20B4|nr:BamA/TamA family outer membrane protein [Hymenobacter sp. CRA2]
MATALQLTGCSPMRLLGPKQRLLTAVRIDGVRQLEREPLDALLRQRPNRRFPVPQLAIYNLGYTFYNPEGLQRKLAATQTTFQQRIAAAGTDSVAVGKLLQKRERQVQRLQRKLDKGNAIMRIGEPPVIYDSTLTAATAEQMRIYLRSKGFFREHVAYADTTKDRRVTVTYRVHEGPRFQVSQLHYDVADSAVARLIRADTAQALLRVGRPYDESLIGQERTRLETMLKNQGYYDFKAQYITLEADTSFEPTTVRLLVQVANPADADRHQVYTVRNVSFVTDAGLNRFGLRRDTVQRNNVNYLAYNHRFSTRILDRKLLVRPGERYSLQNTIQTQRQLAGLDVFRYAAINYQKPAGDSTAGVLDAVVNVTPLKRFQETLELGGTYVAGRPGPFGNFRVRVRNAFGGAEVLELGLRAGLEGQFALTGTGPEDSRRGRLTTQLGANVNLTLPQFLVPWRTNRFFTNYSPRTRLTTSYNYVDRQEYTRTNLEATYDYIWQRNAYHQFILTPLDISLVNSSRLDPTFTRKLLELSNGQALLRAFQSVLAPSINGTSLYNDNDFTETRDARYLRLFAELGGPLRKLYTNNGNSSDHQVGRSNVAVYNFVRLNADYRRYHKLSTHQFFVWRLNGGLATALTRTRAGDQAGTEAYIIPYDRYVFAGGGSSVRAWLPRRLGTGSRSRASNDILEQPGELLLEGSLEYRFPIYDFVYGAAFTDFGNVWTIKRNGSNNPPGSDFAFNRFYREIAVGSGLGLRFDFTFLIVRIDLAAKVYDPTAEGSRFVLPRLGKYGEGNYRIQPNIGIGYPF